MGGGRIGLDLIVEQSENGMTPEDIVRVYDTVLLADIHEVIAYYLRHRDAVHSYLKRREADSKALRSKVEAERPHLARRVAGTPQCQRECQWSDSRVTQTSTAGPSAACAAAFRRSTWCERKTLCPKASARPRRTGVGRGRGPSSDHQRPEHDC